MSLTEMAMKIESNAANAAWAAHKVAFAKQEAAQEAAAYEAEMAEEKALGIGAPVIGEHGVTASSERVRIALEIGGRAEVTLRSHQTGHHVRVLLVCRKRKADGAGWVSRGMKAGRVGLADADAIEARDPLREYPDNYVGRFYTNTGEFKAGKTADGARVWTAERVLNYALAGVPLKSEVFLASQCSFCGKKLEDPQSIERGIGPECYGHHTSSQSAKYGEAGGS